MLLLDEPLGALDLKLRRAMQLELRHLNRSVGITFIYVTHDQEEALTMSDRIAVMSHGHILQLGSAEEIYERPANRYVADFIGESNFLEGSILSSEHSTALVQVQGVDQPLRARAVQRFSPDRAVTLAIRPERIQLLAPGNAAPPPGINAVPGQIIETVYAGAVLQYAVRLSSGDVLSVRSPNTGASPARDALVRLCWSPEECSILVD